MNEFFSLFVEEFGAPDFSRPVPEERIAQYRGVLPDGLLSFWRCHGFAGFGRGLFWTVDPRDHDGRALTWVQGIPEWESRTLHVFARTAFGDLYAFEPESGRVLSIYCVSGLLTTARQSAGAVVDGEKSIGAFFAVSGPDDFDFTDENDQPLFSRALERLGALNADEVYGFEPLLSLGGQPSIEHLRKLRMDVHLDIMRQFATPTLRMI